MASTQMAAIIMSAPTKMMITCPRLRPGWSRLMTVFSRLCGWLAETRPFVPATLGSPSRP